MRIVCQLIIIITSIEINKCYAAQIDDKRIGKLGIGNKSCLITQRNEKSGSCEVAIIRPNNKQSMFAFFRP
jgi:hypothetical protein